MLGVSLPHPQKTSAKLQVCYRVGDPLRGGSWWVTHRRQEGQAFLLSESPTVAPALSLHPPLIVKEREAVMAQKDFTETLAEVYVPDRIFFLFKMILILQSVSIFKFLLWELGQSRSENKCKQTTAPQSAPNGGGQQTASVSPCPGRGPQDRGQKALVTGRAHQARLQNKKTPRTGNNCVCSKRSSSVAL